jgi:enoyl-CoA hydratase/carnithine racemase
MPMIIGYKKARELLYFGDTIDAQAALSLGMVNRVVPLAELRDVSLKWAKRLSLISPEALYAAKRAINRGADAGGFLTALYAGLHAAGPLYATKTEFGQRFREIVATGTCPPPSDGGPRSSKSSAPMRLHAGSRRSVAGASRAGGGRVFRRVRRP